MQLQQLTQLGGKNILDFLKKVDKKTWIQISLGLVFGSLLVFFIIWPAWIKRVEIHSKIKALEGQIKTLEILSQKKAEWSKNKETYLQLIQATKGRLLEPGEAALLLGAISKLAKESRTSIIASQPKEFLDKFPPPFDLQYEARLYDFSLEGAYHDMGAFISRIESNPKLLRIQLFSLLPNEANPKSRAGSITLSAVSVKRAQALK